MFLGGVRRAASLWERGQRNGCGRRFQDITARKEARVQDGITDQLRDFIYTGNLLGIVHSTVDGRILDCNEAVVRMLGYSSVAELRAIRAQQLYDEPLQRNEILRRVSASREIREAEVCFRRRDNSRCWALLNIRLLDAQPGLSGRHSGHNSLRYHVGTQALGRNAPPK